ncbi:uncharacterized protein A4U43_C01F9160 [Asparagus officinalis]|uniref:Smr domain-containing protein n=2 Tax=Asparagus officinalis TaxID=4686 RepID=A0A5P1FSL2_ASPOF|nr:uncharacterized protein A4U43_C01F9160 [Asparagus officinalis]
MEALKLNCFNQFKNPPLLRPHLTLPSLLSSNPPKIRVSKNKISTNAIPNPRIPTESDEVKTREPGILDKKSISDELRRETYETLEWPSVCCQVSAFASTAIGRAHCRSARLRVGRNREESEKLLQQTEAAVLLPNPLDFSGVDDVSEFVRLAVDGGLLTVPELCAVERSLRSARGVFEQLEGIALRGEGSDRYHPLLEILQNCDFLTELANKIGFCIDCTLSTILDRASTKLKTIRSERKKNAEKLESVLKEVSVKVFQSGGIDSPLVTRRRSRMCVGIKASHKYLLPEGIVLSVSSSGATYFMEPRDAVELNNMEVRLANSERAEELAILGFLTSEVAISETKIRHLMEKILELDLACAKGAYAKWVGGVLPVFSESHEKVESDREDLSVDIDGIQHPLLLEPSLKRLSTVSVSDADPEKLVKGESPVPLDIKIGHAKKVVVISGPNTGGKTATMKTLGLASIMSKAGIFLPAKNTPRLPWFDQILADIGDHQSLEHNLSTFSGHISRLCKIFEVISKESLVLIDEIGSGTDPSEGVALSTSILQHLVDSVDIALVTTHYADLSNLKAIDSRFENAAMEFCIQTLQPTYRIMWGSTGNSNALSIAKSIGFDQEVLNRAQEWVEKLVPDKQKERQGFLYQSLMEERNLLEAQARETASVLSEVKKLYLELQSEATDLDRREDALKAKEVQRLQQELRSAKHQMDAVVKNFEMQLQKANPVQVSSIIRGSEAAISSIVAAHSPSELLYEPADSHKSYITKIGEKVYVKGLGTKLATVTEVGAEDGSVMVQYGKIKVRVKGRDIKPVQSNVKHTPNGGSSNLKSQKQERRTKMNENQAEETSFGPAVKTSKNTVDLRGLRAEEASHYLGMAISGCKSYSVLFIVHGTGTGAVKERALEILRNHPCVSKFEEESPMNYGCTIAYIK